MPSPFYPRPTPPEHGVNWKMVAAVAALVVLAFGLLLSGGRPTLI